MKMILTILTLGVMVFIISNSIQAQVQITSIKIGNQEWLAENLNVDRFRNGELIPEAKTTEEWITAGKEGKPAWCYYFNDPENGKKCGKFYNWYAVNDKRKLAPKGWHIPTYAELKTLGTAISNNGNALKAIGQGTGSGSGTNTSGFSALLVGYRGYNGVFIILGYYTYFWSSTEYSASDAFIMNLLSDSSDIAFYSKYKASGFNVRCAKDF